MASTDKRTAAGWPAGVVSLQVVQSARVEAQRHAREKLLADRESIQAEIDTLLGRLVRLQRDFEQCFAVAAAPSVGTPQGRG